MLGTAIAIPASILAATASSIEILNAARVLGDWPPAARWPPGPCSSVAWGSVFLITVPFAAVAMAYILVPSHGNETTDDEYQTQDLS